MHFRTALKNTVVVVLAQLLALPGIGLAQQLTGSIEGTVKDASGGVVASAHVELTTAAAGITQSQTTGAGGGYSFNAVKPGSYKLSASHKGFKTVTQDLEVELNKTMRVDLALAVGEVTERVVVTGSSDTLDVAHSEVSTNVESRNVVDLPSITRDITTLVEMVPGARQVQGVTAGGSQVVDLSGNFALGEGTHSSQPEHILSGRF